MKVTITKAADMVGITRATLYRHIDKKGISVEQDEEGNPKIDVAELIRVYGDRVRPMEESDQSNDNIETGNSGQNGQHSRSQNGQSRGAVQQRLDLQRGAQDTRVEMEVLRERLHHMEADQARSLQERDREREQLVEQIESLRKSLEESQEQQKRLTTLITDQREEQGRGVQEERDEAEKMKKMILQLRQQNKVIMNRLKEEQSQKSKSFFGRMFGS